MKSFFPVAAALVLSLPAILNAQTPEYLRHYNPATGFKPAQTSLAEIFLQIAGSLEHHGSPEPYLRHMQKEHARVSALYTAKTGKVHPSRMPAHLSDASIDQIVKNWNTLSPPLQLDAFAKEIGRCTREGFMGTRLTGTLAVEICNQHQKLVLASMKGESTERAGFEELRQRMETELKFGQLGASAEGYETTRRDAVSYALVITDQFHRMSDRIVAAAKPEKAAQINRSLQEWFLDLGYLAHSELEIGILESALRQL